MIKKTIVICLYGGPGTGKSTLAAELYAKLKRQGEKVELVREYVKNWVWEGRKIKPLDEFFILANQFNLEASLYGKVDIIITDAPILINAAYSCFYKRVVNTTLVVKNMIAAAESEKVLFKHYYLKRFKDYKQHGRYEKKSKALEFDRFLLNFLNASEIEYDVVEGGNIEKILEDIKE